MAKQAQPQLMCEQYCKGFLYHKYANGMSFDTTCFYSASFKLAFTAYTENDKSQHQ